MERADQTEWGSRWRPWLAPLAMAGVVLCLSGTLWRAASRPALVVAPTGLFFGGAGRFAESRSEDPPFSLDDLARGRPP